MSYAQHKTYATRDHALTSHYGVHMPTPERGQAFARLIIEGRKRKGWRQEDLVDASGVSRRTLTRWEGGNAERTDPEGVRAVVLALGIDPLEAAIALGYVNPEEDNTPEPVRRDPALQELIDMFEDPNIPETTKTAALDYLRYLRSKPQPPKTGESRAAS